MYLTKKFILFLNIIFWIVFQLIIKFAEITLNINENVEITSNETEEKTFINFGNKNTYCFLTREAETQNSFIHGNCSLPVDKVTKHLEGLWNVKMGLKGNIDEEQSQTMVKVVGAYCLLLFFLIKIMY